MLLTNIAKKVQCAIGSFKQIETKIFLNDLNANFYINVPS
jgi:hypothetical protein